MVLGRPLVPVLAALAAALAVAPAAAASACGASDYAYAGLASAERAYGISARVTPLTVPAVADGHVGAWVGVGGVGLGPGGANEWIQVGLSAFPGGEVTLYYEVARPGVWPEYVEIERGIPVGAEQRIGVVEIAGRRDWWRVWANGRPVSAPIYLPASHGAWRPIATGESWSGSKAVCNAYAFRFQRVRLAARPGGVWRALRRSWLLEDPGYTVVRRSKRAGFVAAAVELGAR